MALQQKILSTNQINTIYKKIGEIFAEQLDATIKIQFDSLEKQLNQILKSMQLDEIFHSSGKHKGWVLRNATPRRQALAARGYLIIMKFREYLTNERIDYRYYYEDSSGVSKASTFSEENILQYIKFGPMGLQINPTQAKLANVAEEYNTLMEQYFSTFTTLDYMQPASQAAGYVVRSKIMEQYEGMNPGLRNKKNQYQFFNKGHIYEAIDTSISAAILEDSNEELDKLVENFLFGRYLAYDNIKASQGADNPITNTSIKSGSADLYDYSTIKTQLETLQLILFAGTLSKEEMAIRIQDLFLHKSQFNTATEMEATAESYVDKIIKDLQNSIKTSS